jgi:hypothetical protein
MRRHPELAFRQVHKIPSWSSAQNPKGGKHHEAKTFANYFCKIISSRLGIKFLILPILYLLCISASIVLLYWLHITMSKNGSDSKNVAAEEAPSSDRSAGTRTYRDYSHEMDDSELLKEESGPVEQSFPVKLQFMLSEMEKDGLAHIVSWQPHGRCFVVHNQPVFVQSILPL